MSDANRNPDYTAGVLMSRDKLGNYYIEDVYRIKNSNVVLEEIIKTARQDGLDEVEVIVPRDTGSGVPPQTCFMFVH